MGVKFPQWGRTFHNLGENHCIVHPTVKRDLIPLKYPQKSTVHWAIAMDQMNRMWPINDPYYVGDIHIDTGSPLHLTQFEL